MSSEPTTLPSEPSILPVLNMNERRVLGVLVEKAKTTPDAYPLSLNALTTGCNQKSNRDPVLDLTDQDVDSTLASLQKVNLVIRITGGSRVERWRHNLYDTWKVDKVSLAILAELLLRGAQTEGELRGRASRMEPIADLDALRAVLRLLAERKLVVYLTPEGRRGTTVTHGFHAPEEMQRLLSRHGSEFAGDDKPVTASPSPSPEPREPAQSVSQLAELQCQVTQLKTQVAELQKTVAGLEEQLRSLKTSLGV